MKTPTASVLLIGIYASALLAETTPSPSPPPAGQDTGVRRQAEQAIERGLNWLVEKQHERGSWSSQRQPALSAFAMLAFAQSGHAKRDEVVAAARSFLLTKVQDDGGIYHKARMSLSGGLTTYNTAICMTSLGALNDPHLTPLLLKARMFLAASQRLDDSDRHGGFGYNRKGRMSRPDLNNTTFAIQAMRLTEHVEDSREPGEQRVDIDTAASLRFLERLQNYPISDSENGGGFHYDLADPKAGIDTNNEEVIVFRAYGSMTYSGMLALIYSNVDRADPRVRSAFDWAARHWSLDENPGMGARGLFFFFNVLSRALNAYGVDDVPVSAGELVAWRTELMRTVIAHQTIDESGTTGYWVNRRSKKFMEGDTILVTCYALLALQTALGLSQ